MLTRRQIYQAEVSLAHASCEMTSEGVMVDEPRRLESIRLLEAEIDPLKEKANGLIVPLLKEAKLTPKELNWFTVKWCCPCCRGGKKKSAACWSCAGLEKAPLKKDNITLFACKECGGEGKRQWLHFNVDSPDQKICVLYKILRLPKKFKDSKLTSDEGALKKLVRQDNSGMVKLLLTVCKHLTAVETFKKIEPGPDGAIRTFCNPAGTETGRFNHKGGRPYPAGNQSYALEWSTNLGNVPKKQAARNPLYNVRKCMVPRAGYALIEGDLSQAEARVTAALAGDQELLELWGDPAFDVHKWTASHIFNKPLSDITKADRVLGKTARHALNYGMGIGTLFNNVNGDTDLTGVSINMAEARDIYEGYHRLHPKLREWWQQVFNTLEGSSRLTTPMGRERLFFGKRTQGSQQSRWLDQVHKEGIAFLPQSTIADHLNINGLLGWWRQYNRSVGRLLLQIHDAILVEVPLRKVAGAARLMKKCLEKPIIVNGHKLLIPADISYSENSWGEMVEMEL